MTPINAWNATVPAGAKLGSLAMTLSSIYALIYMAIGGWLLLNLYNQWAGRKIALFDAGMLFGRWLGLMAFTFYYLA